MSTANCDTTQDLLPEWIRGDLGPEEAGRVQEHLADCPSCRAEADLLQALAGLRPEPPAELEGRIRARVREAMDASAALPLPAEGRGGGRTRVWAGFRPIPALQWALPAAAVFVLAMGSAVIWRTRGPTTGEVPQQVAVQEASPEAWLWDDGEVAGGPVFDGLTDEELEALLKELEG